MSQANQPCGATPQEPTAWHSINWRRVHRNVRRLQARIVKAVREGKWQKAKALVYLLTHSFSGRALAVLRVTSNRGASTPGVDQEIWNTPELKTTALDRLHSHGYTPQPLRRVYIPKSNGKLRALGIPCLIDRAQQALYLSGLDPIVETQADYNSFGFRLRRCCADALTQGHRLLCKRHSPEWILEGDIRACFDQISHPWLLTHIPMDPSILQRWLTAGYLEKNVFFATTEGTPQGGIISPALANRTLDGLEALLKQRFAATRSERERQRVHLVRYADDFLITGTSKRLLRDEVQPLVAHFLSARGLELSHEKTTITHVADGLDFLGENLRRYPNGKVLLKPAAKNVRTFLAKIKETLRDKGSRASVGELIQRLNQQIRGWALYHRHASSGRTYASVDHRIFQLVWRFLRRRHPQQGGHWLKQEYYCTREGRRWVLHGKCYRKGGEVYSVYLLKASSLRRKRHTIIRQEANPYEPCWESYYEERFQEKLLATLAGKGTVRLLWADQEGKCAHCGQPLTEDGDWQIHHRHWRVYGGDDGLLNLELVHGNCHRQIHRLG